MESFLQRYRTIPKEEIESIIQNLPFDKSMSDRPAGFNTDFVNKNVGLSFAMTSISR
jgi:hypothetical protein